MNEILRQSELFAGMTDEDSRPFAAIARPRSLDAGEYLFLLGENADRLYVVLAGKVDVCFPFSFGTEMRDLAVESKEPGDALGWSALVKPYRFTLSARAAGACEVACFSRQELMRVLDSDAHLGQVVYRRISEIIGQRFLAVQALWVRELQRLITGGLPRASGGVEAATEAQPGGSI